MMERILVLAVGIAGVVLSAKRFGRRDPSQLVPDASAMPSGPASIDRGPFRQRVRVCANAIESNPGRYVGYLLSREMEHMVASQGTPEACERRLQSRWFYPRKAEVIRAYRVVYAYNAKLKEPLRR